MTEIALSVACTLLLLCVFVLLRRLKASRCRVMLSAPRPVVRYKGTKLAIWASKPFVIWTDPSQRREARRPDENFVQLDQTSEGAVGIANHWRSKWYGKS